MSSQVCYVDLSVGKILFFNKYGAILPQETVLLSVYFWACVFAGIDTSIIDLGVVIARSDALLYISGVRNTSKRSIYA